MICHGASSSISDTEILGSDAEIRVPMLSPDFEILTSNTANLRSDLEPESSALMITSSCGGVSSSAAGILGSAIQVLRYATETLLRS